MKSIKLVSVIGLFAVSIFVVLITVVSRGKDRVISVRIETEKGHSLQGQKVTGKPVFNVFVENSGSMNGYVKGVTRFEQAVYGYLSDIKIADITDTLNLFYINSDILPQGKVTTDLVVLEDFIERLEPASFAQKGGNKATTDLSNTLKMILKEGDENTVSVFVSDCIFSPGKGKNAQEYLVNQEIGIKNSFAECLKRQSLSVVIYQLSSQFGGLYFNREDTPRSISTERPYYIWIMGSTENVSDLIKKVPKEKLRGSGVQNSCVLYTGCEKMDYAILQSPKIGSFNFSKGKDKKEKQTNLYNPKKESKGKGAGKFMFAVGVDFSHLPLDDAYVMNPDNYFINNRDYTIEIEKADKKKYSHILKLSTQVINPCQLSIKLMNTIPTWVEVKNDSVGLDLYKDNALNKTFGIKSLVRGVSEAFAQ